MKSWHLIFRRLRTAAGTVSLLCLVALIGDAVWIGAAPARFCCENPRGPIGFMLEHDGV
jgi:hypothetical protein